jgi:hypothetical protein
MQWIKIKEDYGCELACIYLLDYLNTVYDRVRIETSKKRVLITGISGVDEEVYTHRSYRSEKPVPEKLFDALYAFTFKDAPHLN